MRVSQREMMLASITISVMLAGLTFIAARPLLEQWRTIGTEINEQYELLEQDKELIASRASWDERFAGLSKLMPAFTENQKMDIYWLTIMDQMANKHGLQITKRQVGEEKRIGDVYEISIDVREWEGTLDALVNFLFELQSQGVMMDITLLYIRPVEAAVLRGRFVLNCAFSRGKLNVSE